MKKQLLLLVMTLLPMVASADAVEIGGIYYNLVSKLKSAEVTSNPNKYTGAIEIPSSVTYEDVTYSVTSIGNSAFYQCYGLTSVTIPNSVTSIGNSAFYRCYGLTSVTIPNSVTSIGNYAFFGCSGLTSVTIPNSVTSIGSSAFQSCSGLTSVTIPNSVTSIGDGAFQSCSGLTSVTIPNSVTSIGDEAFRFCSGLTSVHITDIESWCKISFVGDTSNPLCYAHHLFMDGSEITQLVIPNGVTSIGNNAFCGCSGLTSVTIPNSVTSIGVRAFQKCSGLISVTIPNSVTDIGNYSLANCSKLETIIIGSGVNSIGNYAFASCPELVDVYCYAENVPTTISNAFNDSYIEYATLHVPEEAIEDYGKVEPWNGFKNIIAVLMCKKPVITITNGVVEITCPTIGAEIVSNISYGGGNIASGKGKIVLAGTTVCHIEAYATKEDYVDSDVTTADVELCVGKKGDVNQDGVVSISDAVSVVNIILNGGSE